MGFVLLLMLHPLKCLMGYTISLGLIVATATSAERSASLEDSTRFDSDELGESQLQDCSLANTKIFWSQDTVQKQNRV